jgi:23S rRNA (cytosine1962-C5)-methyltransferase
MAFIPLYLKKNQERRLRAGHLWIYNNEIDTLRSPLKTFLPGQLVNVYTHENKPVGTAYINPHSLICARLLTSQPNVALDQQFFTQRMRRALSLRERLFAAPYYRLIYGESDGLPGVVVDRFDQVVVVQITTAGMEQAQEQIVAALDNLLNPQIIVLRNDTPMRELEGLPESVAVVKGITDGIVTLQENQVQFQTDVLTGQKTGWFYDHRMNRARASHYAAGQKILDVFSYIGGWGIQAAVAGAKQVWCVDSSQKALDKLAHNAALNQVTDRVKTLQGDAFEVLKELKNTGEKFDMIILDPPAFIKRKKDQVAGETAYRRINQLALQLLTEQGILVAASCSLHLARDTFLDILRAAGQHTHLQLQILEQGHQAPDHPLHPAIAETAYLKSFICRATT